MADETDRVFFRVQYKYKNDKEKVIQFSAVHPNQVSAEMHCKQAASAAQDTCDWHVVRVSEHAERVYPKTP